MCLSASHLSGIFQVIGPTSAHGSMHGGRCSIQPPVAAAVVWFVIPWDAARHDRRGSVGLLRRAWVRCIGPTLCPFREAARARRQPFRARGWPQMSEKPPHRRNRAGLVISADAFGTPRSWPRRLKPHTSRGLVLPWRSDLRLQLQDAVARG